MGSLVHAISTAVQSQQVAAATAGGLRMRRGEGSQWVVSDKKKKKSSERNRQRARSCAEQADSAQQSKHTAGSPREAVSGADAASISLLVAPAMPASLPDDSCTALIYFSPPHLAGRLASHYPGQGVLRCRATEPGQGAALLV